MSNYYDKRDARVNIAHQLMSRGWEVLGYKKDESDGMTDYYSPADWGGIATKNGFTLVVDCKYSAEREEIRKYDYSKSSISQNNYNKIKQLEKMTQANGATEGEEANAKALIEKLSAKKEENKQNYIVIGMTPGHMANPNRMMWHLEKDGSIYDKGNKLTVFADCPASYVFDIAKNEFKEGYKTCYIWNENRERVEVARELDEREEKAVKEMRNFILRIERIINSMNPMGDGTQDTEKTGLEQQENEKLEKVIIKKTKKVLKMVEVKRNHFQVGDYVTLPSHGHYWLITHENMRQGTWKGVKDTRKTFTYEIVGKESRGYQRLKNPKGYYNWASIMEKQLAEGTAKIYELKEVEVVEEVEKWVKVKSNSKKEASKTVKAEVKKEEIKTEATENNNIVTIEKDIHTQTGEKLFVVKLTNKVSKDKFKNILFEIKSIGGYYSKFKNGFIFKSEPTELLKSIGLHTEDEPQQEQENPYEHDKIEEGYLYNCHFKSWKYSIEELKEIIETENINYHIAEDKVIFENLTYDNMVGIELINKLNQSILFIDEKIKINQDLKKVV